MLAPLLGVLVGREIFYLLLGLVVFVVVVSLLASFLGYWTPPWSSPVVHPSGQPVAPYGNWVGGLIGLAVFLVFLYIVLRLFDVLVF
jgi:hypothetical protein